MKFAEPRPYAGPEKAARRLLEIANTIEPVQDGRIHIEKISAPFLARRRRRPNTAQPSITQSCRAGYGSTRAGPSCAFTPAGADLFA
jgi:hypothetical protein